MLSKPLVSIAITMLVPYNSIFRASMPCIEVNRGSLTVMKFCPFIFEAYSKAYVHDLEFEEVYQRLT